ncbi:1556_t:CDS:2 [Cetraspora pellucida]|uniref:1556_t:CDS:1 n=1 Tax=Cetraspora pellucida TaxID=1433469 RepID=A0A9N9FH81_9GLOM|nr:1556_t:CDS:2 [Cetraspora pellucida]
MNNKQRTTQLQRKEYAKMNQRHDLTLNLDHAVIKKKLLKHLFENNNDEAKEFCTNIC